MRRVFFGLLIACSLAVLAGCNESSSKPPNDPPPAPQDSGADKGTGEPKPVPPKE